MAIKKRPTTDLPPDPEPAATPGLSKGGGTQPRDTPPASGQETQPSNPDPVSLRKTSVPAMVSMIALAVLLGLFLATAVLLIMKMSGVFN
ncbi:hypothetical protein DDK07_18315 [Mycobacteroides abscessus]|uniref:DUF6480 family protein n=1 Tax=Mycobacteroides abscessus TaxID=36809 RepID=UPI0005E3D612|nr:DUF6480 family protein [Mycobacteroides abscessus]AKP58693.1 hypothetical protein MAUC22_14495 [Mycobacteroides abscessus UC22]AMU56252.1 hypothetical protein A3O02_14580 [Mycobacteroides abscessus]MBE5435910.1 hypothetical protein [Mycobacteroides abscessus]MBE5484453.1 hypothetical protein [Mycobacteroides abscessus]MBN7445404.1 hypothetical protein [Mycobacteroides abscessus subsp. abscessus]